MVRPVNTEALTAWVDSIPSDVRRDMASLAPMLTKLGYYTIHYPPNYGEPDQLVKTKSKHVQANAAYWKRKADESLNITKELSI